MPDHWPKELRERIEAAGYFTLTTLGILFRKSPRVMSYTAAKGHLGQPRVIKKRKLYSLAICEIVFREMKSAEQVTEALRQARVDQMVKLSESVRTLRDFEWQRWLQSEYGMLGFSPPPNPSASKQEPERPLDEQLLEGPDGI
jgi:hypothetical protein